MEFEKNEHQIIFIYEYKIINEDWLSKELENENVYILKNTFHLSSKLQVGRINHSKIENIEDIFPSDSKNVVKFKFAKRIGDYYKIIPDILNTKHNVFFHKEIELSIDYFIAEIKISVFKQIDNLIKEDIYIGGKEDNAIPIEEFDNLIKGFPTTYEKKLYAEARITSIIGHYFESISDSESKFKKYLNKRPTIKGESLREEFQEYELLKFQKIHEKLVKMLKEESAYNENQWQDEILQIILILYPKYIKAIKSSNIKTSSNENRFLDFLLIDYNGHIDIIEVKKPFDNSIMSKSLYRKNFIPKKELSGTIMQLEKYIYHLNRSGKKGEEKLQNKYKKDLPKQLEIKITNPKGLIIMGRENDLTTEQKKDFEIIKRKYINVIDIITYDDLIRRLEFIIEQIKVQNNIQP